MSSNAFSASASIILHIYINDGIVCIYGCNAIENVPQHGEYSANGICEREIFDFNLNCSIAYRQKHSWEKEREKERRNERERTKESERAREKDRGSERARESNFKRRFTALHTLVETCTISMHHTYRLHTVHFLLFKWSLHSFTNSNCLELRQ